MTNRLGVRQVGQEIDVLIGELPGGPLRDRVRDARAQTAPQLDHLPVGVA
ncbi:hypothetical protein [Actinokineospora sp. NPDC004072]